MADRPTPDRTFEYMLNAMEHAAKAKNPADELFGYKRQAVLNYVAKLEAFYDTVKAAIRSSSEVR